MFKSALTVIALTLVVAAWPGTAGAQIKIGGSSAPYTSYSAPFDLIWFPTQDTDANGFPVNPTWAAPLMNVQPNFAQICNAIPEVATCTSQFTQWDPEDAEFSFFGECGGDPLPGHLNWRNATYLGYIQWEGASGSWPQDNDINMRLDPLDSSTEPLDTGQSSLGLEFDSTETINNFGDPFWQPGQIGSNINGDFAVVSGLLGVDGVHNGGWTEIHPVYALAIMTNLSSSQKGSTQTVTTTWQYFIRNFGNEGGCGSQGYTWSGNRGSWYLTLPVMGNLFFPGAMPNPASFTFTGSSSYWTSGPNVGAPNKKGGVNVLSFGLPCLTISSTCKTGVDQYQAVSIGIGLPQQSFEDGVITMAATFTVPGQARMQRRPYTPATLTQDWHERNEATDIVARINDPNVRSNVQALVSANRPAVLEIHDTFRGNVAIGSSTTSLSPLSSSDVEQLSAVHAAPEDPTRQRNIANLRTKLKAIMPSTAPSP